MAVRSEIDVVHRYLEDARTTWSVAVFGAIAEFHRDPDEEAFIDLNDSGGTIYTDHGACRIDLREGVRMLPYEFLSKRRAYWLAGVAFCLPEERFPDAPVKGLREAGVDRGGINTAGSDGVLFDLGLGLRTMTAMVRTADEDLIELLRDFEGVDILGGGPDGHAAYTLLREKSPTRVFECPLGRIEVHSPIPPPDAVTPHGPHTHILPNYLSSGRTHSANVPIPDGWLPCLHLHPPNPVLTHDGEVRPAFDQDAFAAFQDLLRQYGRHELIRAKEIVETARAARSAPPNPNAFTREERTATRVALRQAAFADPQDKTVMEWQAIFEPMRCPEESDPDLID